WIGLTGDAVMHGELQRQARDDPAGFGSIWAEVADLMAAQLGWNPEKRQHEIEMFQAAYHYE
ncbi:MAG: hypothetical protein ACO3N7_10760, partial [Kiritimatiellia bacterium]